MDHDLLKPLLGIDSLEAQLQGWHRDVDSQGGLGQHAGQSGLSRVVSMRFGGPDGGSARRVVEGDPKLQGHGRDPRVIEPVVEPVAEPEPEPIPEPKAKPAPPALRDNGERIKLAKDGKDYGSNYVNRNR